MKALKFIGLWSLLFIVCIIFRLPNFLSDNFFFDIDEATIGIMAKDVLAGKPIPYYFYFQNYGFSTVETLVTAGFIKILGPGVWALKLAGLFLYSLAGTFLMLFLIEKKTKAFICVCALIIISAYPPWYIWGSLMRGGYLTSLVCATAVFYIIQTYKNDYIQVIITGFLFYIAYESHIVIFLSVFPLLIYWLLSGKKVFLKLILFTSVFLTPLIIGRILFVNPYFGSIQVFFSFDKLLNSFDQFKVFFLESFTNFYIGNVWFDIPQYWVVFSIILLVLIIALITFSLTQKGSFRRVILLLIVGALMSVAVSMLGESFSPRYVLGFFTGILFLVIVSIQANQTVVAKGVIIGITLISLVGITTGSKIRRHWINASGNELGLMEDLYHTVKSKKIKALYSIDKTFIWDYLYGDEIPSTNICGFDRTPRFVDHLLQLEKEGANIGLFGNAGFQYEIIEKGTKEDNFYVSNKYFLIENVNDSILQIARNKYCVGY